MPSWPPTSSDRVLASLSERGRLWDAHLRDAIARVPLLAHVTPSNFEQEVNQLAASLAHKSEPKPLSFSYDRPDVDLAGLVEDLVQRAGTWRESGELGALYADRACEIALEAEICTARGTSDVSALSAARFSTVSEVDASRFLQEADRIALEWSTRPSVTPPQEEDVVTDDDRDPRSLLRRMREEIGARRLPFRVVVTQSLAPLAAVGDGTVHVAAARKVTVQDVERTVRHEIEGHILPATRARTSPLGILQIGTARGSDHQEGWALLVEERGGFWQTGRQLEVALRHAASRAAHQGRDPREIAVELAAHCDQPLLIARSVCRAFRGGGLGREAAYLPALLAVRAAFETEPDLERTLTSGRVSVQAARVLAQNPEWLTAH